MDDESELRDRVDELASLGPSALLTRLSDLERVLSAEDPSVRRRALGLAVEVSDRFPAAATGLMEPAAEGLGDDDLREDASQVVANLAAERPEDLEAHLPLLVTAVDAGGSVTGNVTYALSVLAGERPGSLAPRGVLNRLFAVLSEGNAGARTNITRILGDVARAEPDALADDVDALQECLDDSAPAVQGNAAYALGYLAEASPAAVFDAVDDLCHLLESADRGVRTAALYALCASTAFDAVDDHAVVALLECLDADAPTARRHAAFLLATVAAADPEAVEPHAEGLARHAADSDARVRHNLHGALEKLEASDAAG